MQWFESIACTMSPKSNSQNSFDIDLAIICKPLQERTRRMIVKALL